MITPPGPGSTARGSARARVHVRVRVHVCVCREGSSDCLAGPGVATWREGRAWQRAEGTRARVAQGLDFPAHHRKHSSRSSMTH